MSLNSIILKGLLTVYGPLVSFVAFCGLLAYWTAVHTVKPDMVSFIVMMTLIISTLIGWLWWSYKIVKWKCWAFSKVKIEDSYKLYSRAVGVGLIWPTGSKYNKTEIWTKEDKDKWSKIDEEIQELFRTPISKQ